MENFLPKPVKETFYETDTAGTFITVDAEGMTANTYRTTVVNSGRIPTSDPAVTVETITITRTLLQTTP